MKRFYILLALLGLVIAAAAFKSSVRRVVSPRAGEFMNHQTVDQRLRQYGSAARARMRPYFAQASVCYPPRRVVLVGLKAEHELQLYAAGDDASGRFIRSYSILAASGVSGPKLRAGDRQVPEGIYPIELLNPNSLYHLTGLENITVILAPLDFRVGKNVPQVAELPSWTDALYQEIRTRLAELPLEKHDGR